MFPDSQMCIFSNVHIKVKDSINRRVLFERNSKNRVTKYALEGIAMLIRGEYNYTHYKNSNDYVPHYIAVGTNEPSEDDRILVSGNVTANDTHLLGEILDKNNRPYRFSIKATTREDSSSVNDYIRLSYKIVIPSGVISKSKKIRELGLFTKDGLDIIGYNDETNKLDPIYDIYSGLWARVIIDPVTIPDNAVLDITWDIVLASSSIGVYPTSINIGTTGKLILPVNRELTSGNNYYFTTEEGSGSGKIYYKFTAPISYSAGCYINPKSEGITGEAQILSSNPQDSTNTFIISATIGTVPPQHTNLGTLSIFSEDGGDLVYPDSINISHGGIRVLSAYLRSSIIKGFSDDGYNTIEYEDVTYNYCEFTFISTNTSINIQLYKDEETGDNYLILNGNINDKIAKVDIYNNVCSIENINTKTVSYSVKMTARAITGITDSIIIKFEEAN